MSGIDRVHDEGRASRLGVGWLAFTAALLVTMGIFRILDAFWAFRYDDDIPEGLQTIIFDSNLAAWGWIWLLLGTLMILAGFAVVQGKQWARWFGIAVLAVAAITNYTWIVFRPFWTLVLEGVYLAGIYGLAVYGARQNPIA